MYLLNLNSYLSTKTGYSIDLFLGIGILYHLNAVNSTKLNPIVCFSLHSGSVMVYKLEMCLILSSE